jgi:hypothetical protein
MAETEKGAEGTEGFCGGATQSAVAAGKPGEKERTRANPPLTKIKTSGAVAA